MLGNSNSDFKTQSQVVFKGEFVQNDRSQAKNMVKDFRSNHYTLGHEENKLESEMQNKFRELDKFS